MRSLLAVITLLCLMTIGCRSQSNTVDTTRPYQAAMLSLKQRPTLQPGTPEERQAIDRFKNFLSHFTEQNLRENTRLVYASDAFFHDTLTSRQGAEAIEKYLLGTLENSNGVEVEFLDTASSDGNYYFRWVMDVHLKKLKKGTTVRTVGMTHIRFDATGKVVLHQDYWDAASGLFEFVPVVGSGIRFVKRRLEK